jgi:hypothetical protein
MTHKKTQQQWTADRRKRHWAKYEAAMTETRQGRAARGDDAEAVDDGSVYVGRDPEWDALCEQHGRKDGP